MNTGYNLYESGKNTAPIYYEKGGSISVDKAKKILKDGKIHGKALTNKQKKFFGFIAGGGKPSMAFGGAYINNTGYLPEFDTSNNPYNIIPSNDITMDGVPMDLLAIPNKGNPKILKSNSGRYKFNNADYVTEIPMAQNGMGVMDKLLSLYIAVPQRGYADSKISKVGISSVFPKDGSRYSGISVDYGVLQAIRDAANKEKIDPYLLAAIIGRESTFGKQMVKTPFGMSATRLDDDSELLTSGWDVLHNYNPVTPAEFLTRYSVPGISSNKSPYGYTFKMSKEAVKNVNSRPDLIKKYENYISSVVS